MSIKTQGEWIDQMAYLLTLRRLYGIVEEDALRFILREGFGLELHRTKTNLLRLKRINVISPRPKKE